MSIASPLTTDQRRAAPLAMDDFRRLGVRPFECRQTVIRLAAQRAAQSWATQQLTSPSSGGALQLSRVAASTYRLLDPRRRDDPLQRVLVGRILIDSPSDGESHCFLNESEERFAALPAPQATSNELYDRPVFVRQTEVESRWTNTLQEDDLVQLRSISRWRWRRRVRSRRWQAWGITLTLLLTGLLVGAVAGWKPVANWNPAASPQVQRAGEPLVAGRAVRTTGPQDRHAAAVGNRAARPSRVSN